MKRFLITTAEISTWKTAEKVLFLGEWCRRHDLRAIWETMDYEIVPYHWDDRERLAEDFRWLEEISERYLQELTASLNRIHCVDYSLRYWRIVIGPWLGEFIQILFDRYTSVRTATDLGVETTICMRFQPDDWIPLDISDFNTWKTFDSWNHHIYSEIIKEMGRISYFEIESQRIEKRVAIDLFPRRLAKKALSYWNRLVPSSMNRVVMVGSRLQLRDQLAVQWVLGQLPYFGVEQSIVIEATPNWETRGALLPMRQACDFENVLRKLLPRHIPIAYLEGYKQARCAALKVYPKSPKVIYTAVSWHSSESFKLWAAEKIKEGAKFVIAQHGGNYGAALLNWCEGHEMAISDGFGTWGWENGRHTKFLPSGVLVAATRRLLPNRTGRILWVGLSLPRYSYWLYSIPIAGQLQNYREEQLRFAYALDEEIRSQLLLRLFPIDSGWGQRDFFTAAGLEKLIDDRPLPFWRALRECKLCVATYNATTFLETLAADFPTIVFWNPRYWELRESALPFYDALAEAGILHYSPESAAEQLSRIHENPLGWWQQENVQKARQKFIGQFARISENWVKEWVDSVKTLADFNHEYPNRPDGQKPREPKYHDR